MSKLYELIEKPISGEWGEEDTEGNGTPVLRTTNFTNEGNIKYENIVTRTIKNDKVESKFLKFGDIIIEKSGGSPTQPVGRVVFFKGKPNTYLFNNFTSVLRIKDKKNLFSKYLFYTLFAKYNLGETKKFQNKTTGILNLKLDRFIKEIDIPLPSLEEQHKIASILDTVSEALKLRKQQLNELDLLVKSKFVEMFGDPVINSKKLPTTELINIVKLQRGYDLPTQSRNSQGNIPVYGSNGILDYHNEAKTINGIITGRSGTIGRVYYCFDKYWPLNTTLFSIDTYGNNILYLSLLLQYFKLERFYSGTGVPTLNRNIIHKEQIIVVSIKEQNKFASFVEHVDKLKSEVQKSIEQLQTLFDSLMQEYFE